jgi:hypothetical protein
MDLQESLEKIGEACAINALLEKIVGELPEDVLGVATLPLTEASNEFRMKLLAAIARESGSFEPQSRRPGSLEAILSSDLTAVKYVDRIFKAELNCCSPIQVKAAVAEAFSYLQKVHGGYDYDAMYE